MRQDLNGRPWLAGSKLVLGHGLIFAATGPAIGTLLSPGVIILPIGVLFSYLTSTPVALLAGLLTGAVALHMTDETRLWIIATCIGAACGMLVPIYAMFGSAASAVLALYAIDGAFAAAVCTHMTKGLRQRYGAARVQG